MPVSTCSTMLMTTSKLFPSLSLLSLRILAMTSLSINSWHTILGLLNAARILFRGWKTIVRRNWREFYKK